MTAWALNFHEPQPYQRMVQLQNRLLAARISDDIPDVVLFLEHRPVVTLGRRGRDDSLRVTRDELEARGIELAVASRGGDVTYHGPGQLVMYPIIKLGACEADARGYLCNLEEIAIRTAGDFGVQAFRREGMNGAWTEAGKIAAIGFRLKRWVTCHGMSLNVKVDLEGFETIVPCGLAGEKVASLKTIMGEACPSIQQVRDAMARHFKGMCGRALEVRPIPGKLPGELARIFHECS